MSRWTTFFMLLFVLGLSNFFWQFIGEKDWEKASERTYFQAAALFAFALFVN